MGHVSFFSACSSAHGRVRVHEIEVISVRYAHYLIDATVMASLSESPYYTSFVPMIFRVREQTKHLCILEHVFVCYVFTATRRRKCCNVYEIKALKMA